MNDGNAKGQPKKPRDLTPRFGIGEWFGTRLTELRPEERRRYAEEQRKKKKDRHSELCPFKGRIEHASCTKDGGVCSLRLYSYEPHAVNGRATAKPIEGAQGGLRVTCPNRFFQDLTVFNKVGEILLGDPNPKLVGEVGFLESDATTDSKGGEDVGRFDMVLVSSKTAPGGSMEWCALEIQGVYFSGDAMTGEFVAYEDPAVDWVVFPAGRRRPDYRSSGPKRLMPQLQIKIPTLRRWGKKMALVVDRAWFDSMGEMDRVSEISNADIAWFIVRFEEIDGDPRSHLVVDEVRYTTLERSVEGLTGGKPVPKPVFEGRIAEKIKMAPTIEDGGVDGTALPDEVIEAKANGEPLT